MKPGAETVGRENLQPLSDVAPANELEVNLIILDLQASHRAWVTALDLTRSPDTVVNVFVPQIIPYPLDLSRPVIDPVFIRKRLATITEHDGRRARLSILLCRTLLDLAGLPLKPGSVVLIAPGSRWRLSESEMVPLARGLRKRGHRVLIEAL